MKVQSSRGGELRVIERSRGVVREQNGGGGGGSKKAPLDLEKVGGSDMRVTDSCHYYFFTPTRGGMPRRRGIKL